MLDLLGKVFMNSGKVFKVIGIFKKEEPIIFLRDEQLYSMRPVSLEELENDYKEE